MAVRARLVQAVRTMVEATVFPSPPVAALKRARAPASRRHQPTQVSLSWVAG